MPFCPKCRYEFIEGVQTCNDCGIELVSELPPEEEREEEYIHPEWETVLNVASEEQAEMVIGVIRASNIPAMYKSFINQVFSFRDPRGVDILVPVEFKEQAEQVLETTFPCGIEREDGLNQTEEVSYETDEEVPNEIIEENDVAADKDSISIVKVLALIFSVILLIILLMGAKTGVLNFPF